jgi:hypothetical protein
MVEPLVVMLVHLMVDLKVVSMEFAMVDLMVA